MRCENQQGFLLHSRPYSDTSLLVDLFTQEFGRVRCVAKGFRKAHKKGVSRTLFPHVEYTFDWTGRSELKTLIRAEVVQTPSFLRDEALYMGLYINELLYRLMQEQECTEYFYAAYKGFIGRLFSGGAMEAQLRLIEMRLLEELGFGLVLGIDADTGDRLVAGSLYQYTPEIGLQLARDQRHVDVFLGQHLLAVEAQNWESCDALKIAKKILRSTIDFYLDGRPLNSRELYRQYRMSAAQAQTQ